ncbi:energy-coupled thiamine transporter ThiT [Brassicibacter mesophilus]|uniref:energy-coupled thiamine transporter ThiT n=1 Tax=Brassicibacter mesophilus TaxID=745119 RepID=UPI003D25D580
MNNKNNVRFLTESGVMIALASILSMIKVYEAPFGGSVTAGSMIPIIIIALRWGTLRGLFAGLVYGIIQAIIDPYIVHPVQFFLDYPVAFSVLGVAGLFRYFVIKKAGSGKLEYVSVVLGVFVAVLGRMIAHVLSGVVFFKEFAGDQNPWIYSILYNGGYLSIELIVSIIIILLLWKTLRKEIA